MLILCIKVYFSHYLVLAHRYYRITLKTQKLNFTCAAPLYQTLNISNTITIQAQVL